MSKRSTRIVVCMVPIVMLAAPAGGQQNGDAVVTAAVQVTANPNPVRAHATPLLARNPRNGELVIAEVDVRGSRECAVHISADDGRSWFRGGDIHIKPFTDCSIGSEYGPHVMPFFDPDGVLYVVTTANDPKDLFSQSRAPTPEFPRNRSFVPRNVYLARSTDGGRTFDVRLAYEGPKENPHLGYNYAPVGAVDPENPRNVYVGWAQGEWQSPKEPSKAVVSVSTDEGKTFGAPYDISQLTGSEHPWISVGSGGVVHAAHWSKGFGKPLAAPNLPVPTARQDPVPIYYVSSRDQGKTWNRMELDPGVQAYYRPPVIAADPNSDAVYVVWFSTVEPRNFALTGQGADRTEIFLKTSLDGGRTWGERQTVNDDAGKEANHSLPGISIAPNGRVDIAWSDSRNSPRPQASPGRDQGLLDIYYASSEDQGRTFTPSRRINDRAIDRSLGVWSNNVNASVATGMASTDSSVYFAWQDARAGANEGESEDVYFATLKRDGHALVLDDEESVPGWAEIAAGVALGLGIGMVVVWAIARRARPATPAAVLVLGLLVAPWVSAGVAVGQQPPATTAATQVTTNPAPVRAHSAPQMARNPKTGELVVGEVDVRGSRRCRVHISADGGRSWFDGGDPMVEPFTDCSIGAEWGTYLSIFFDDEGALYVPFAANDPKLFERSAAAGGDRRQMVPRHIFLARSTDSGRTFTNTMAYMAPAGDPARGYAYAVMGAIDPSAPQRVYVTWAQGEFLSLSHKTHAVVAASDDGGRTFEAPVDITDEKGSEGAWLTVGREGVLHAVFFSLGWDGQRTLFQLEPDDPPLPLIHARSSDHGRTWTREVIDPGYQQYERPPVVIADPDSSHLYLAWFGSTEPENLAPHFDDTDRADIFVKVSSDGGDTWGERTRVNDDRGPDTNQVHPGLAIAPNGRLDVAWYDYRSSPTEGGNPLEDRGTNDVYYASSSDGGRTFGANVKVNDRSIDRSIGVFSNRVTSVGPVGITSTDDEVFFAWQDSRNGDVRNQAEDVYAGSLRFTGARLASASGDSFNWGRLASGVALGMGLAMVLAWALTRRTARGT